MYMPEVHDYGSHDEHGQVTQPFLAQNRRDAVKREIGGIVDDEFDRLGDYANTYISDVAADRAERFLERVLKGDEDAAMSLLGDKSGGMRIRQDGSDEGTPWARLIHGRLFETNPIKLRRQIVEAHADLITSERIADLEATVIGLSQQIRGLEKELR